MGSTVFIRQSQLDSFLILFPNCKHVHKIDIAGQYINNLIALKHLNNIDHLSIIYTNIISLAGLENLRRSQWVSIKISRSEKLVPPAAPKSTASSGKFDRPRKLSGQKP